MKVLDELERLSKAATPGPWKTEATERENSDWVHFNYKSLHGYVLSVYGSHITANKNDAELIAAMRNSIDALINVARAAQMHIEYLEKEKKNQFIVPEPE